jgi:hypothetical protein
MDHAVRDKILSVVGVWSLKPPDLPAKIAAVLAVLLLAAAFFKRGTSLIFGISDPNDQEAWDRERRRFLAATGLIAALLSVAYVSIYLRGGSRIIDATTYFLQGRALSHGDLAWPVADQTSASFRGRFLIYRETGVGGGVMGGVFPPGYPLMLAIGFLLGSPMLIGPLLAAAIVIATYRLARILATPIFRADLVDPIARVSAIVSLFCGALRYHTADTMSHGASALAITLALGSAIVAHREKNKRQAIVAGLLIGYVIATRPVSAIPIGLVTLFLLLKDFRLLVPAALGLIPGVLLLLYSQHAVTGSWFMSTQRMYYAMSDGPPNCFRYGFGKNAGCVFEHGDFVEARLQNGYGVVEALGTTLRRIRPHLLDIANFELLAPLIALPIVRSKKRNVALIATTALIVLQILAYVPFYFDGSYPGAGARFFADVLPVEHVLLVLAVTMIATRAGPAKQIRDFTRGAFVLFALMLVGFFVHAVHEHIKLRDRDSGPMFEPDVLAHASLTSGLVFVDTDHGFGLGNDPNATNAAKKLVVARLKNDARDRMLFDALDRPPTYLYRFDPGAVPPTKPTLTPWAPPEHEATLKLEGESEWPPLNQQGGGITIPGWVSSCASNRRALVIAPTAAAKKITVTIALPVPSPGRYTVGIHLVDGAFVPYADHRGFLLNTRGEGRITIDQEVWTFGPLTARPGGDCWSLATKDLDLRSSSVKVTLEATGGTLALDYIGLKKTP